jgi:hypothetical protein
MAETLRKVIQDSGKPIAAIAKEAGIAQPVLHRFFTGERDNLRLDTVEKLARYFKLELRSGDPG